MKKILLYLSIPMASVALFPAVEAEACRPAPCASPYFGYPSDGELLVPPDVGSLYFGATGRFIGPPNHIQRDITTNPRGESDGRPPRPGQNPLRIQVIPAEGGDPVPHSLAMEGDFYRIDLDEDLAPEQRYRVEGIPGQLCITWTENSDPRPMEFSTSQPLPDPPTALGPLLVEDRELRAIRIAAGGSCFEEIPAVTVDFRVDEEHVGPWAPYLHYRTRYALGGDAPPARLAIWEPRSSLIAQPPHGQSWVGRGRDRFYRSCESYDETLAQGLTVHVQMEAMVPGRPIRILSEVASFQVQCDFSDDEEKEEHVRPTELSEGATSESPPPIPPTPPTRSESGPDQSTPEIPSRVPFLSGIFFLLIAGYLLIRAPLRKDSDNADNP